MSVKTTNLTGNNVTSASFLDVLLALKENIARDTNVADLVIVDSINNDTYKCKFLANERLAISCIALDSLEVKQGDIMLAIFTSSDFRTNLQQYKDKQPLIIDEQQTLHSKNYGVLVGLVYREKTEDTNNATKQ